MKKLTALLLALVLALGLTACTRNDTKKLAGTWTYRADITERINQRVKEALELVGIEAGPCAMPVGIMTAEEKEQLKKILTGMGLIG